MNIEELQIEVQASSRRASENLEKLEEILLRVDAIGHRKGLDNLYQKLKKIASLNFSGVEKGLGRTAQTISGITKGMGQLSRNISAVERGLKGLSRSSSIRSLDALAQKLPQITAGRGSSKPEKEPFASSLSHNAPEATSLVSKDPIPRDRALTQPRTFLPPVAYTQWQYSQRAYRNRFDFEYYADFMESNYTDNSTGAGPPDIETLKVNLHDALLIRKVARRLGLESEELSAIKQAFADRKASVDSIAEQLEAAGITNDKYETLKEKLGASDTAEVGRIFRQSYGKIDAHLDAQETKSERLKEATKRISDAEKGLNKLDKAAKKARGTLGDSMKTILMYSLLFSAVSTVTKGVTEGLQNVALYSEEANAVMTEYKTTTLELKNSIGAALVPTLELLFPVFQLGSDILIGAANSVNVLVSSIGAFAGGDATFIRAKRYVDDYAKSLGKASGMLGMDQINKLDKQYQYSEMFEEVELTGWDFAGAITNIGLLIASITALQKLTVGTTTFSVIGAFFKSFGGYIAQIPQKLTLLRSNLSTTAKYLGGGAGLAGGFALATKSAYDLKRALSSDDPGSVYAAAFSLVGGVGLGAAGGFLVGGPIGALIGGLSALAGALIGAASAQKDLREEMLRKDFYAVQGKSILEVRDALDAYFSALDFDKNAAWIDTVNASRESYDEARDSYDLMWRSISQKPIFDASDIEGLTEAFDELIRAAKELNETQIGSLMASIRSGIELNITPELTSRLDGLLGQLNSAVDLINAEISGLQSEYQAILKDITANGGAVTEAQKEELAAIRKELTGFVIDTDPSATTWRIEMEEALKHPINAGENDEAIKENLDDLLEDRDKYLADLKTKYAQDSKTLEELIRIDQEKFGGALGFQEDSDNNGVNDLLETLKASYEAQRQNVMDQYKNVLAQVYQTYSDKALDYNAYHHENGFLDMLSVIGNGVGWIASGLTGGYVPGIGNDAVEWSANRDVSEEQKKFLEYLQDLINATPTYATGGFPEDGLFMANHEELVGRFSNGRTAVVNNEQIIEGIKRGVREANEESSTDAGGTWIIQVVDSDGYVKSENIITAAERRNRRDGKTVIALG